MKPLFNYLCESIILEAEKSQTSFSQATNDFDDLLQKAPDITKSLERSNITDKVRNFIQASVGINPSQNIFIYSLAKNKFFKIPRSYNDVLKATAAKPEFVKDFSVKVEKTSNSSETISIFCNGVKIIQTGTGSIGKVPTDKQELSTCAVWNAYIESIRRDGVKIDLNDLGLVKDIVNDIYDMFDESWLRSFGKQIIAIIKYMYWAGGENADGSPDFDPKNYNMTRYDYDAVGKAYANYIRKYTNIIGGQKDNFDPSDVILYLYGDKEKSFIISKLNQYASESNPDNVEEVKAKFFWQLFNLKYLRGISLKKIESERGRYDLFNILKPEDSSHVVNVSSYELVDSRKDSVNATQVKLLCNGIFNFNSITDEDGNPQGQNATVVLCMRSFGKSFGIDVTLKGHKEKGPALGKCPVRIWKEKLGIPENASRQECVTKFREFINNRSGNDKNVCKTLKELIAAAIKEGPLCFPFVLIH